MDRDGNQGAHVGRIPQEEYTAGNEDGFLPLAVFASHGRFSVAQKSES